MLDISAVIKDDHDKLQALCEQMAGAYTLVGRHRTRDEFLWQLNCHMTSVESVLQPLLDVCEYFETRSIMRAHQERSIVQEVVDLFQTVDVDGPRFGECVQAVWSELYPYIKNEQDIITLLEKTLRASESERLAHRFKSHKVVVPGIRGTTKLNLFGAIEQCTSMNYSGAVVEAWADGLHKDDSR